MNPNVNYRLWVIIMCQFRLIDCNKYTTLVSLLFRKYYGHLVICIRVSPGYVPRSGIGRPEYLKLGKVKSKFSKLVVTTYFLSSGLQVPNFCSCYC